MKILVVANTAFTVTNFRLNLLRKLKESGVEILVASSSDGNEDILLEEGIGFVELPFFGRSANPFLVVFSYIKLLQIYTSFRPTFLLSFTIKPNFLSSLVPMINCRFIPNITGLGSLSGTSVTSRIIYRGISKLIAVRAYSLFVQNKENFEYFREMVTTDKVILLPGSGVDLDRFKPNDKKKSTDVVVFSYISRIMAPKGIFLFLCSARKLLRKYSKVEFLIAGRLSNEVKDEFFSYLKDPKVTYLGELEDVREVLKRSTFLVLPTYYNEGTPRALIEAAAFGLPLITTDTPGCRDLVSNNGYLVQPRSEEDLFNKMEIALNLGEDSIHEMGANSRHMAEAFYSEERVIQEYFKAIGNTYSVPGTSK